MNQKTVIILVLVACATAFLVLLALSTSTEIGESVTQGEIQAETEATVEPAPGMPQGKIDVRVACESALMYTTFTDGAAANAFIEECVEGKHPEVIERYISDMGVDGAVI